MKCNISIACAISVPLISIGLALPAFAACEGDACSKEGVLRECHRYPSGDSVWINKTPFTRCEYKSGARKPESRPPVKFTTAPKKKPVTPPSPYVSPEEKKRVSTSSAACVQQKNQHARRLHVWIAQCQTPVQGHAAVLAEAARQCSSDSAAWSRRWQEIQKECPQYRGKRLGDDGTVAP